MRDGKALEVCGNAAWIAAARCRRDFVLGKMTEEEFLARRARQDAVYNARFKSILTRLLAAEYAAKRT